MNTRLKDMFVFNKPKDFQTQDRRIALQRQHKCLERTHSNPVPDDHRPPKPEFRRTSSEGNRSIKVPTISITTPRFESCSDSESSSSKFGIIDDEVFYHSAKDEKSSNYLQKNLLNCTLLRETFGNLQSYLDDINNETNSPLESHEMRGLRILKFKIQKCRICEQTVYFRGFKCIKCGLIGHRKCIRFMVIRCPNTSLPPKEQIFGLSLESIVGVPQVIHTCISELERRPFNKLKGIYRTNGNPCRVSQICISFGFGAQFIDLRHCPHNDITDVLKIYLNKLLKPLVNSDLQLELIRIGKEWPQRKVPYTKSGTIIIIFELREVVNRLATTHFIVISYLMHHLKRLTLHKREVETNESTLAIQFTSIIFKQIGAANIELTYNPIPKIRAIELMITNATEVFGPQPNMKLPLESKYSLNPIL